MVQAMRRLLAAAEADLVIPPALGFTSPCLRAYLAWNQ
jgi:hypothetical protein